MLSLMVGPQKLLRTDILYQPLSASEDTTMSLFCEVLENPFGPVHW